MGLFVESVVRVGWTSNSGGGNTFIGQYQANHPGQGQPQQPRQALLAQVREYMVGEPVLVSPGNENTVTLPQILAALNAIASDIAGTGAPIITPAELAIIRGWNQGQP
jgi:hypothetical protein